MRTATLDDFMAFNDQLAALLQAGVPVDVGLAQGGKHVTEALQEINASVARRVSQGASLSEALDHNDALPTVYRNVMQVGLHGGDLPTALNGHSRLAQSVEGSWHAIGQGLLYPLIVCCLAYAGFVVLCLYFVPTLESLYESLRLQPGLGLRVLQGLRDTLPFWVAILPVTLLVLVVWRLRAKRSTAGNGAVSSVMPWPGMAQSLHWQRCANFADSLATLLDSGLPYDKSLAIAAGAAGDASLSVGVAELLAARSPSQPVPDDSSAARRFPPFLRWALLHSAETTGISRGLRMAARLYRDAAQRRTERIRVAAPLVTCILLGGGATLLYGLAIFVPVVEMFRQLSF